MMLEQLLAELGQAATTPARNHAQIELAASVLLFSMLSADYVVHPEEAKTLLRELERLFSCPPARARKLVRRAASAYRTDSAILASATFLKLRTGAEFRQDVMVSAIQIAVADGETHFFEIDLVDRIARLLGVSPTGMRNVA